MTYELRLEIEEDFHSTKLYVIGYLFHQLYLTTDDGKNISANA